MKHDPTEHPRPLLRRAWRDLGGEWAFSIDKPSFDRTIVVPFAPESPASGIGTTERVERCWYRRSFAVDAPTAGQRVLAHFSAVDREALVFANGDVVGQHTGGYTPFFVDVTDAAATGELELTVRADDDTRALDVPRGKQDWADAPHAIWYPRTTGIWRTPWLEVVPEANIAALDWVPDAAAGTITLRATLHGVPHDHRVRVRLDVAGRVLVDDTIGATTQVIERTFRVSDGSMDEVALRWYPRRPVLVDAVVAIVDDSGTEVDRVESYTALRDVTVDDGRVLINGRPYPLHFALDQGYWPETGATPPSSDALRRDVELTKALGFNGARKHQKTEDPRYFAWADRLGLLTWVEMPSAYVGGTTTAANLLREWPDVIAAYRNHPSVIGWVPINESWGVPNIAADASQAALVEALAAAAHALDGTRPVSANDGWETVGGDIVGVHDYDQRADVLAARYASRAAVDNFLAQRRPDGRWADLDRAPAGRRAVVLSEFGGIRLQEAAGEHGAWGYADAPTIEDFVARYTEQWAAVHASTGLAGACWTQLTDTYQEMNGLLRADRTPKAPVEDVARATRGR